MEADIAYEPKASEGRCEVRADPETIGRRVLGKRRRKRRISVDEADRFGTDGVQCRRSEFLNRRYTCWDRNSRISQRVQKNLL